MNPEANPKDYRFLPDDTRITLCHCKLIDMSGKSETLYQWRDWAKRIAYSPIMRNEDEARNYPVSKLTPRPPRDWQI